MMKLFTKIPVNKESRTITYNNKLILIGSCFAEHIAGKLDYYKFQVASNPLGILFHPIAIENLVSRAMAGKKFSKDELFSLNESWHSFEAHSSLSNPDRETVLLNLNSALQKTNKQIKESGHLIITLGTAWAYRHNQSGRYVANCHKVPQKEFTKELLGIEEITSSLRNTIGLVQEANPNISIILTISPVRHLKDGFVENSHSKAYLISALHKLLPSPRLSYFPSYEIVMDELRDYRFYAKDLVHPNDLAIDYIWQKFSESWIDRNCSVIMEKVEKIHKGLQHRPFSAESKSYSKFKISLEKSVGELQQEYPFMQF